MPFYEYECQACKFYTEVMQKITDAPLSACPSCGKRPVKKLVSAPVFRLKGGGWYETDFKSDKENKRNLLGGEKEEAAKKDDAAGAKKPEAKDAKPAEAKDAKPPAAEKPAEPKAGERGRAARGRVSVSAGATRKPARASRRRSPRRGRR
ncbi:MAG TPA: zinc ribbon domain-containing protein [Dongiaceae bacterium]